MTPEARTEQLLVQDLNEEVLVYDTERHKAHTLNRTAALIWRHCDGKNSLADLTHIVASHTRLPADEGMVWLALEELDSAHLLRSPLPPTAAADRYSRRDVARRLARSARWTALVPAVLSITAPTAAQAASCRARGQYCTANSQCCSRSCVSYCCT